MINESFVNHRRSSRGIRQILFHVLRKHASPSVLVDLGFISNSDEGAYLSTDKGKKNMANALYEGFVKYKEEFDRKNGVVAVEEKTKVVETTVEWKTLKEKI